MEEEKVKISELEATNTINDEDILPIVQNGATKKVTTANLLSDVYDTIDEIVDKEAYSTSETVTNKVWIDNKPIYRKVIYDTTSRNSGTYGIQHGISNLGDLVNIQLIGWQNATTCMFGSTSPLDGTDRISYYYAGNSISIRNSWASIKIVIIIEYTKTTD